MIYRYYNVSPDATVKHVKQILSSFGNVVEFEVFRNQEDSPYVSVVDGVEQRYTFILKDDNENEFWFWTLCGYGGSGPQATNQILQLLGLKYDFGISKKGNDYIRQTNIKPKHELNFVVSTKHELFAEPSPIFMARIVFDNAFERYEARRSLQALGYMNGISKTDPFDEGREFFKEAEFDEVNEYPESIKNNEIVFDHEFRAFSFEQLKTIIKSVVEHHNGKIEFYNLR